MCHVIDVWVTIISLLTRKLLEYHGFIESNFNLLVCIIVLTQNSAITMDGSILIEKKSTQQV